MSDTAVKTKLRTILADAFNVSTDFVYIKDKTTDIIVKPTDNEKDWYYFEIKSTDKSNRKNADVYFGAASLNQLRMAVAHPKRYYFILANKVGEDYTYALISMSRLLSYLTGFYLHADFNIPDESMTKYCLTSEKFTTEIAKLKESLTFTEFPNCTKKDDKKDKRIKSLKKLIKK